MFLHIWKETGLEGLKADFAISDSDLDGAEILLPSYTDEDYQGDAYVLFRRDGKLFEVVGGHCSCYGLSESSYSGINSETQWQPEETSVEAVRHRLESAYEFRGCRDELRDLLKTL